MTTSATIASASDLPAGGNETAVMSPFCQIGKASSAVQVMIQLGMMLSVA